MNAPSGNAVKDCYILHGICILCILKLHCKFLYTAKNVHYKLIDYGPSQNLYTPLYTAKTIRDVAKSIAYS